MYTICKFPSSHGTPWKARFYIQAIAYAYFRFFIGLVAWLFGNNPREIRIINMKTNEHKVL